MNGRACLLLARVARTAGPAPAGPRDPAGHHAAAAARRLRQHRQPLLRARQRTSARDRRPARDRRRLVAHRAAAARREPRARACSPRRSGRADRALGHAGAPRHAAHDDGVPGPVSDQRRTRPGSRLPSRSASLCAVIFGAAPALQLARVDPQAVPSRRVDTSRRAASLRQVLMAAEVALALVVLVAAGLFLQSFRQTRDDPGFRARRACCWRPTISTGATSTADVRPERSPLGCWTSCAACPDVESAAIATADPARHSRLAAARVHARRPRAHRRRARSRAVEHRDARLLRDDGHSARWPATTSRDLARHVDAGARRSSTRSSSGATSSAREALGRRLDIGARQRTSIAGVVRNSLYESFGEPPTPIVYLSYRDRPSRAGRNPRAHTRRRRDAAGAAGAPRGVRDLDPALPVYNVRTLTQHVEMNLALRRIPARMFVVLGPLLLVLAAIGIYAVVAYTSRIAPRRSACAWRSAPPRRRGRTDRARESRRDRGRGVRGLGVRRSLVYTRLLRGSLDVPAFVGCPAGALARRHRGVLDPRAAGCAARPDRRVAQ